MKNNGERFDDFLKQILEMPNTSQDMKILVSRISSDTEFQMEYLKLTTVLMTAFPELFLKLQLGVLGIKL